MGNKSFYSPNAPNLFRCEPAWHLTRLSFFYLLQNCFQKHFAKLDRARFLVGLVEALKNRLHCNTHYLVAVCSGPKCKYLTCNTVWFIMLQMENSISERLCTSSTNKTIYMPGLVESMHHFLKRNFSSKQVCRWHKTNASIKFDSPYQITNKCKLAAIALQA